MKARLPFFTTSAKSPHLDFGKLWSCNGAAAAAGGTKINVNLVSGWGYA